MNLTPLKLEKGYTSEKLGNLSIKIPDVGEDKETIEMKVSLSELFKYATGLKFFEYQTKPENIEALCAYGSSLYKHFPLQEKTILHHRKKYILFGPNITRPETITAPREFPNDFDVMVITKKKFTLDDVVIPKRAVQTLQDRTSNRDRLYGYYDIVTRDSNLHITYRSVNQFLNGLGKGDELSESVVKYGLIIAATPSFEKMLNGISNPKREPLHSIHWDDNEKGKLNGKIK
jgi:hypothetical protein